MLFIPILIAFSSFIFPVTEFIAYVKKNFIQEKLRRMLKKIIVISVCIWSYDYLFRVVTVVQENCTHERDSLGLIKKVQFGKFM